MAWVMVFINIVALCGICCTDNAKTAEYLFYVQLITLWAGLYFRYREVEKPRGWK